MNCPVCGKSGLTDDHKLCPECHSDLEAFHLTQSIEKAGKRRLNYGIVFTILFIAAIAMWFLKGTSGNADTEAIDPNVNTEISNENVAHEQTNAENVRLAKENQELKARLKTFAEQTKKREKTYVVKEGESLYSIARKVYGNGYRYVDLAKDNKIENPDQLITGQKLIIYY
ncbi:MAG: LysM peptidoglycan-binding domain-containing protein [Bacteroidales bacterium]|nr:LysM peptidoglycan-binding domain-containing protein [Bacteroidales bacterium]MCF8404665.1 LysM peptidoglycan-binding domain-containing protein [Bacteroidales bacterium]